METNPGTNTDALNTEVKGQGACKIISHVCFFFSVEDKRNATHLVLCLFSSTPQNLYRLPFTLFNHQIISLYQSLKCNFCPKKIQKVYILYYMITLFIKRFCQCHCLSPLVSFIARPPWQHYSAFTPVVWSLTFL